MISKISRSVVEICNKRAQRYLYALNTQDFLAILYKIVRCHFI